MANLANFRTAYPHCTIETEWLGFEHGQHLVRCCIAQRGCCVASGLSAGGTMEAAEDQARDRALALLAQIGAPPLPTVSTQPVPNNPPVTATHSAPQAQSNSVTPPPQPQANAAPPAPLPSTPIPAPVEPVAAMPTSPPPPTPQSTPLSSEPLISQLIQPLSVPLTPVVESELASANGNGVNGNSPDSNNPDSNSPDSNSPDSNAQGSAAVDMPLAPLPSTPAPQPTVLPNGAFDFTEIIAQTNREMTRLGWTKEQGRSYLIATYGKNSRTRLNDQELLSFLDYLKSLP